MLNKKESPNTPRGRRSDKTTKNGSISICVRARRGARTHLTLALSLLIEFGRRPSDAPRYICHERNTICISRILTFSYRERERERERQKKKLNTQSNYFLISNQRSAKRDAKTVKELAKANRTTSKLSIRLQHTYSMRDGGLELKESVNRKVLRSNLTESEFIDEFVEPFAVCLGRYEKRPSRTSLSRQ
ncbi:hypothetical protein EVAR_9896_1 [Eumeta japonica]|uniref:Uncharacterized protein n=1 Tax=Eumeta variegata TaxID=151549 RepID=A0A4C1TQC2_EUMVA|nr:hypothetical protein EVAR_9896_1 [Eumeta japonica]